MCLWSPPTTTHRRPKSGANPSTDSNTPTWENNLTGHINLRDANRRTINYAANGMQYRLNSKVSTLIVRCVHRLPQTRTLPGRALPQTEPGPFPFQDPGPSLPQPSPDLWP